MFSERSLAAITGVLSLATILVLTPLSTGCGRKEDPKPPPSKNPARTTDLRVRQRGMELRLTMSYPSTTAGGLALPGIDRAAFVRYTRPAPEFMEQPDASIAEAEVEAEAEAEDEAAQQEAEQAAEIVTEEVEAGAAVAEGGIGVEDETIGEGIPQEEGIEAGEEEPSEGEAAVVEEINPYLQIRVDPDEFRKQAENVVELEGGELEAAVVGGRIVVRIPLSEIQTEPPVAYSFRAQTAAGRLRSPDSNIASFVPLPPPQPPSELTLLAGERGIKLLWSPPESDAETSVDEESVEEEGVEEGEAEESGEEEGEAEESGEEEGEAEQADAEEGDREEGNEEIEGFHVYRRLPSSTAYSEPLASLDPDQTQYVDTSARFGTSYVYAVTTVRMKTPLVESALSVERDIDYSDDFAPAAPTDLVVLAEAGRTRLVWESSRQRDVVGYLVFVSLNGGDPTQLTPEPIRTAEYIHEGTVSGATYAYTVVAVDSTGNRSEPSEEATTRAP